MVNDKQKTDKIIKEQNNKKIKFMKHAIKRAEKAFEIGEVPVGAIVVYNGKVISSGYNMRTHTQISTRHAEMIAIEKACRKLKSWRLQDCDIYVTLEPCPMCMGAIINSRIDNLYFGAYEQKGISYTDMLASSGILNHTVKVEGGICEKECSEIITRFFNQVRQQLQEEKEKKAENTYTENIDGAIVLDKPENAEKNDSAADNSDSFTNNERTDL
jgi:tRNA(adenine34) deaminase